MSDQPTTRFDGPVDVPVDGSVDGPVDGPGDGPEDGPDAAARDARDHGSRSGTTEGTATHLTGIVGRGEPFESRPRASVVHADETTKIVAFEFGAGQELGDHAAHHPILVQLLRGRVEVGLPDRTLDLVPGEIIHLTARLRHSVRALEPSTLTVTMLLPRD